MFGPRKHAHSVECDEGLNGRILEPRRFGPGKFLVGQLKVFLGEVVVVQGGGRDDLVREVVLMYVHPGGRENSFL